MTRDNKPPMSGPSAAFDPATYEPRSGKTFWMAEPDVAGRGEEADQAGTIIDNGTTSLLLDDLFNSKDNSNRTSIGSSGQGMDGGSLLPLAAGCQREAAESSVALEALTEKIQRQDRLIAELQAALQRAREASVDRVLGQLRLREAVLLYVGQDANKLIDDLGVEFARDVVSAVSNSLFVLDNAPVPAEVRDAIRKATKHGMNRW